MTKTKLIKLKNAINNLCGNAKLIPNPFDKNAVNVYAVSIKDLHEILENKEILNVTELSSSTQSFDIVTK